MFFPGRFITCLPAALGLVKPLLAAVNLQTLRARQGIHPALKLSDQPFRAMSEIRHKLKPKIVNHLERTARPGYSRFKGFRISI